MMIGVVRCDSMNAESSVGEPSCNWSHGVCMDGTTTTDHGIGHIHARTGHHAVVVSDHAAAGRRCCRGGFRRIGMPGLRHDSPLQGMRATIVSQLSNFQQEGIGRMSRPFFGGCSSSITMSECIDGGNHVRVTKADLGAQGTSNVVVVVGCSGRSRCFPRVG